jgi:hypothetical protein
VKAPAFTIVVVAVLAAAPTALGAERCTKPGAKTLRRTAEARIFSVRVPHRYGVTRRFYGCARGHAPRLLTRNTRPRDATIHTAYSNKSFRLSGRFVAWVQEGYVDFGPGEVSRWVEERPLEAGHRQVSQSVSEYDYLTALRLRDDGALAWLAGATEGQNSIWAVPSASTTAFEVTRSNAIDPRSLRFDRTSLHWVQDGADRDAPVS